MDDLLTRRRELMNQSGGGTVDPYVLQPFTMIAMTNDIEVYGYIGPKHTNTSFKYNLNNTGWVSFNLLQLPLNYEIFRVSLSEGDSIQFIGEGVFTDINSEEFVLGIEWFGSMAFYGGYVNLEGNLMSLIGGDNFVNCTTIPDYCFYEGSIDWFSGNEYCVKDITNLRIAATTVGKYALYKFFYSQYSLEGNVKNLLPATNIDEGCYKQMFQRCIFLTNPPDLPATTLAKDCYYQMFTGCTRLTSSPSLPATTLAENCYRGMFSTCSNLATAGPIAATTLANGCCYQMFNVCSSLTTAPVLHATTLVSNCYSRMFRNCTSLSYIKAMFTTEPSTTYTSDWVISVPSGGTFIKNSAAQWSNTFGNYAIPTGWTVQTASS